MMTGMALAGSLCSGVAGAPQPDVTARSWQLEFEFHDPSRISVLLPGDDTPTTYWYLLYTVTNNTGGDIDVFPEFDLVTDTIQVIEGGRGVHPEVYEAVKRRHARRYPFFVMPADVFGILRQGDDNRKTSAIAFKDFDPQASGFVLYVAGLSGELERVANPAFSASAPESDKNVRFYVLRKTLSVSYDLPGDPNSRRLADPVRTKRKWVMR